MHSDSSIHELGIGWITLEVEHTMKEGTGREGARNAYALYQVAIAVKTWSVTGNPGIDMYMCTHIKYYA